MVGICMTSLTSQRCRVVSIDTCIATARFTGQWRHIRAWLSGPVGFVKPLPFGAGQVECRDGTNVECRCSDTGHSERPYHPEENWKRINILFQDVPAGDNHLARIGQMPSMTPPSPAEVSPMISGTSNPTQPFATIFLVIVNGGLWSVRETVQRENALMVTLFGIGFGAAWCSALSLITF